MRSLLSIFIMILVVGNLQAQLNDYKYIIVPKKFDDFREENQHMTSTLVKYLFTQKGFNTVYDDAMPDDLNRNRCLGLLVKLDDNSSMFTTKTALVLLDCNGQEVFVTQEGRSKKKDYKASYNEAITKAFASFGTLAYSYSGKGETEEPVTISFKDDVKELKGKDTVQKPKLNKYQDPMVQQEATPEKQSYKDMKPVESEYGKAEEKAKDLTEQVATPEEQRYTTKEPMPSDMVKAEDMEGSKEKGPLTGQGLLYAQEIPNGYQLVDSSPKVVLKIFNTSVTDVYTAQSDNRTGVVYKKEGKWFYEYYVGEDLTVQELNIKF
ncbi:hypothetical protein FK220_002790 [Flavobacteriaceae bacterium TP-CH-4]|uniref:Uncharacterized protein n=1 Tax=Pelagihabitans pacificus TaxID=2696054 RepID=A0A967AQ18_9FLAO|nr:hypothetical protein [Pelagihabitans pacificus]NHF58253.1 hypothetical protein [Pelagihabitans pacificus]